MSSAVAVLFARRGTLPRNARDSQPRAGYEMGDASALSKLHDNYRGKAAGSAKRRRDQGRQLVHHGRIADYDGALRYVWRLMARTRYS